MAIESYRSIAGELWASEDELTWFRVCIGCLHAPAMNHHSPGAGATCAPCARQLAGGKGALSRLPQVANARPAHSDGEPETLGPFAASPPSERGEDD